MKSLIRPWIVAAGTLAAAICPGRTDFPDADLLPVRPGFPDPLVTFEGRPVRTAEAWFDRRRPELKALFQYYMYGGPPANQPAGRFVAGRVDRNGLGGAATLKQIDIRFGPDPLPVIRLMVVVPNGSRRPAPVFLGLNFDGNHALVADTSVFITPAWMYEERTGVENHRATEEGRGLHSEDWSIDQSVARGYAVATFYNGDIEPDDPENRDGIRARLVPEGRNGPGAHEWGTIAAWAWGLMRAVDYLVTDPDIDPRRIAVVGHSRNGKAALVAAAFDERIAMAVPHQAGCGGSAPSRSTLGESVRQINERFPHWFCEAFHAFNGSPERLPFDQHCLVALVAPRPVLFTNAVEDTWANPPGQFEMLKLADKVYRLLGMEGLEASAMPETGKLVDSRLGYFIRPGKHAMTRADWKVFLDFADRNLKPAEGRVK
jgi:hypothetical protein